MIETFNGGLLKSAMEKDNPEYVKFKSGLLGKSNVADQLAQSGMQSQNQLIQAENGVQQQMAQQMAQAQQETQQRQAQEKAKQQQLLSLGLTLAAGGLGAGAEAAAGETAAETAASEGAALAEGAEALGGAKLAADAGATSGNMWDKFLNNSADFFNKNDVGKFLKNRAITYALNGR